MPPHLALLLSLLASTACAQVTTSYLLPNSTFGTNRLRYVASVLSASGDRVTLVANVADDPDFSALGQFEEVTYTLAPTLFEASTSLIGGRGPPSPSPPPGVSAYGYRCDIQPDATTAACTFTRGPWLAAEQCAFGRTRRSRAPQTISQLWTFSEEGQKGTDTLVWTIPGSPSTLQPEWCGTTATAVSEVEVPSSALVNTVDEPRSQFGYFQFVITAGEEKLASASATVGGAVKTTGATATATTTESVEESKAADSPGSAPMRTVAPVVAGMGAAVAMFL